MSLPRLQSVAGCCLLAAAIVAPVSAGDLEASAGVANTYLFRGVDVNDGRAQVFGDLTYRSDVGVYLSGWGSSAGNGANEVDMVLGYSRDIGPLGLNVGAISYIYPGDSASDDFGSEAEAFIGLAWEGFELYYYDNVSSKWQQNEDYFYVALSYVWRQFAATLGHARDNTLSGGEETLPDSVIPMDEAEYDYTHVDVTYAFNDNLSFTVSKIVDRNVTMSNIDGVEGDIDGRQLKDLGERFKAVKDDSLLFVLTYSLPLEF